MDRRLFLARSARTAVGFGILRSLPACASSTGVAAGPSSAAASGPAAVFAALRDRYFIRTLQLNPVTSTYLGGDGYAPELAEVNGTLRDFRPAAIARELAFLRETRSALDAIDPTALSSRDRIDQSLIAAQSDYVIRLLGERRYHERSVDTYVTEPFRGVDWQIQQMTDAGNGMLGTEAEWKLVVRRMDGVPAYLETAKANLLAGRERGNRPDFRMVQRDGIAGSTANGAYFRSTIVDQARRYLGGRPFAAATLREVERSARRTSEVYSAFGAWLAASFPATDTTDRFASGAAEYDWRLRHNLRFDRTAAELFEYGARQTAMYEERIYTVAAEVAASMGLTLAWDIAQRGPSVRTVMAALGKDAPKNDDELFRWYREVGERAVAYGRERELFDIPASYRLDVEPTPPVLRSTIDAAYYMAPPFQSNGVGRFYLTPTDNDAATLAQNNRASVADTAIHEGFPGHDWHFKYMTQHRAEISNVRWLTPGAVEDSSSMWEDSPPTEGWGLYSEELMSEPAPGRKYGFYTAAEYLYELQGQLMRAVRVHVDPGIHTGRMTFDQAVDHFAEHVSFYPGARAAAASDPTARAIMGGAERAIYRYSKWPTQAVTYNLGKSAIIELRDDFKAKRGGAYRAKDFHERFMRMGTIPVAYFREMLLEG